MLKLHIDQFRLPQVHNIHLFEEDTDLEDLRSFLVKTAEALNFHLVILEGQAITSRRDLLTRLGHAYQFPKYSGENYERLSWDGANDWLGDLMWLTSPEQTATPVAGFILLYLNPLTLFSADPVEFALFLDVAGYAAEYHREDHDMPFHIFVGPTNNRMFSLTNLLRIREHFNYL